MIGQIENPVISVEHPKTDTSHEAIFSRIVTYTVMGNPDGVRGLLAENGLLTRQESDDELIEQSLQLISESEELADAFLQLHPDKELIEDILQEENPPMPDNPRPQVEESSEILAENLATQPVEEIGEDEQTRKSILEKWQNYKTGQNSENQESESESEKAETTDKTTDLEVDGKHVKVSNRVLLILLIIILGLLVWKLFVQDKEA